MLDTQMKKKLLALEHPTPSLKEIYEREMKNMIEKELGGYRKVGIIFSLILGLIFFVTFAGTAIYAAPDLPYPATAGFVLGSVFGLINAVISYRVLKKGSIDLKRDNNMFIGVMWVFLVFMMVISLFLGMEMKDATQGVRMILYSFIFLYMGGLFLTRNVIENTELNLKENLLRMELKIAELMKTADTAKQNPVDHA